MGVLNCKGSRLRRASMRASEVEPLEGRRLLSVGPDSFGYVAAAHALEPIDLVPGAAGVITAIDLQDNARILVGQHIQQAIGTRPNVANTLMKFRQNRLPLNRVSLFEGDALEMACRARASFEHRTDEGVALPVGKLVAGVKRQS